MSDWVHGSEGKMVSMAIPSDGSHYNTSPGIYSSFPVICTGNGKYQIVKNLQLNEKINTKLQASVRELNDEKNAVSSHLKFNRF